MEALLLDTNIVSFLLKKDSRATLYEPHLHGRGNVRALKNLRSSQQSIQPIEVPEVCIDTKRRIPTQ